MMDGSRGVARTGRPRRRLLLPALLLSGLGLVAAVGVYGAPQGPVRIAGAGTLVRLYRVKTHKTVTLPLEEYLVGAVAAQMPASYPLEALRAQAVAARSLTAYHLVSLGSIPAGADISDDPGQGQSWISNREMEKRWGWAYPYYYLKICDAVWSTRGEIATYGTRPIDAVSFGGSGGHGTENAADIWGVDIPYLKRVGPVGGESENATASFSFDLSALDRLLGTRLGPRSPVRILSRTASGRPLVVQLGSSFMTAQVLAGRLNLPSSYFELRTGNGRLTVVTTGSGSGVGLSRAGAALLAARGEKWPDIIRHYYKGVEITHLAAL